MYRENNYTHCNNLLSYLPILARLYLPMVLLIAPDWQVTQLLAGKFNGTGNSYHLEAFWANIIKIPNSLTVF